VADSFVLMYTGKETNAILFKSDFWIKQQIVSVKDLQLIILYYMKIAFSAQVQNFIVLY